MLTVPSDGVCCCLQCWTSRRLSDSWVPVWTSWSETLTNTRNSSFRYLVTRPAFQISDEWLHHYRPFTDWRSPPPPPPQQNINCVVPHFHNISLVVVQFVYTHPFWQIWFLTSYLLVIYIHVFFLLLKRRLGCFEALCICSFCGDYLYLLKFLIGVSLT